MRVAARSGRARDPRAAAFEPRIRAVAAIDGLFDGHEAVRGLLSAELTTLFDRQEVDASARPR